MQVQVVRSESLLRAFKITLGAGDIEKKVEAKLDTLAHTVKLDGFRPGKVPSALVRQRYESSAYPEVLEEMINASVDEVLKTHNLRAAMAPAYHEEAPFERGKDFSYTLTVELLPEVEDIDLKDVSLVRYKAICTDAILQAALDNLAKDHKDHADAPKGHALTTGDLAVLDFDGFIDDAPLAGGAGKGHELLIGSNSFIPGFEEQMQGMKKGETRTLSVTFPEAYHAKELAGKAARFEIVLHNIKKTSPAVLSDAFAEKFGLKTLQELKEQVKASWSRGQEQATDKILRYELFDLLDAKCKFEVPAGLVELELDSILKQLERDSETPIPADKKEAQLKAWKKDYQAIALRRVRLGLLLAEIGRKHDIKVSNKELEQEVQNRLRSFPGQEELVLDFYKKNQSALAGLQAAILEKKVVHFMLGRCSVSEKEVSLEELNKILDTKEKEAESY